LVNETDRALVELLRRLSALDYDFTTVTPATHQRVVSRSDNRQASDLRDIFGWSLPFSIEALPQGLLPLLERGNVLAIHGNEYKSTIRVARIRDRLFIHSAFPTDQADSVFLGPDTYRFVRFLESNLRDGARVERLVDMGAGSGAGAISAAGWLPRARLTLVDSNPQALRFARINAEAAGVEVETHKANKVDLVEGAFDLFIANPPFMMDEAKLAYRDGGGSLGSRLSREWTLAATQRIAVGGRILLYTGSAVVGGRDALREALERDIPASYTLRYDELDPDIFGEELASPAYRDVERIAAVGAVISRQGQAAPLPLASAPA
jgi:methylase of polypeptide subunit release factors